MQVCAEAAHEGEHGGVVGEDLAGYGVEVVGGGPVEEALHETAGDPPALHGGFDDDGELGLVGSRVADEAGDADGVAGGVVDGDEGDLAVVVDLGHAGDLFGGRVRGGG